MTPTEEPRTPLTLEYVPEGLEDDQHSKPVIIIEPSFQHPGRIFVGVHPFGKRLGCHLLPEDAQRIRNHLGKLLMESGGEELPASAPDWAQRIEAAAKRAQAGGQRTGRTRLINFVKRPKRPRWKKPLLFRLEFRVGNVEGVVGRLSDGPR